MVLRLLGSWDGCHACSLKNKFLLLVFLIFPMPADGTCVSVKLFYCGFVYSSSVCLSAKLSSSYVLASKERPLLPRR
jgi:hypothetical protein